MAIKFYDSDLFLWYKEVGGKIEPYTIVIMTSTTKISVQVATNFFVDQKINGYNFD
jgi:hypothetical protein